MEIVKNRFNKTFVDIIFFIAVISLLFYPTQYFPDVQDFIKNSLGSIVKPLGSGNIPDEYVSKTLIFFTYHHGYGQEVVGNIRNCGAFWEPGMFAVFLNLALVINLVVNDSSLFSIRNIIYIVALITTFSTAGYIGLFVVFIFKWMLNSKYEKSVLLIPVMVLIGYSLYLYVWNLDFMRNKVSNDIETAEYVPSSRLGAALYHFEILKQNPLTGVYLKYQEENENVMVGERVVTPNGISLIFMIWGIPVGFLFYWLLYSGLARWLRFNHKDSSIVHSMIFFVFIISAFSQDITNRQFYYMLLFSVACFPLFPVPSEHLEVVDYKANNIF